MKTALVMFLALSFSLCAAAQDSTATAGNRSTAAAEGFVDRLAAGQFGQAVAQMTPEMAKALPADKLAETWKSIEAQAGPFKQRENSRAEKVQQHDLIHVICRFEKAPLEVKVVLDSLSRVGGLWFAPAK